MPTKAEKIPVPRREEYSDDDAFASAVTAYAIMNGLVNPENKEVIKRCLSHGEDGTFNKPSQFARKRDSRY
jgi:hypothetical protein